jgi:hypothetical protein
MSTGLLRPFVTSAAAIVLAVSSACNGPPSAPIPAAPAGSRAAYLPVREIKISAEKRLDRAEAGFATWGKDLVFVVLSDFDSGSSAGSDTGKPGVPTVFYGSQGNLDGQHVKWKCVTADGKTGQITINAKEYDLAQGALFLVSSKGILIRVRQLQRDLSKVQSEVESLERWLRADEEVGRFYRDEPPK